MEVFNLLQIIVCVNMSSYFNRLIIFYLKFFFWDFLFSCNVSDYTDDCKPDQTKMCNIINSEIFKKCAVKLGLIKVKNYFESCKIDACAYHNNGKLLKSVVCAAIEAYAGECAKAGILVRWRPISLCRKIYNFYSC